MDRPPCNVNVGRPELTDSLRHISSQAAARLAESSDSSSILCQVEFRPPVPRRKVPAPPVSTDSPPPLPIKGEVPFSHGRRNLLHHKVPLTQKIGNKITTDKMRSQTLTHVPIHRPKSWENTTPQIPPRTKTSPKGSPRPLPALEGSGTTRVHNEYVDSPHTQKKIQSGSEKMKPQELKKVSSEDEQCDDSVYCKICGKCRCKACTQPKLSSKKQHMAKRAVDVASCMCCVKACFYHCNDEEESGESDEPCACTSQPHCCSRWTTMAVLSIFLPCLCLYWPLKGCVTLCQKCYRRCSVRGCRCRRDGDNTQEYLMEESSST